MEEPPKEDIREAFREMFEPWPLNWKTIHEVSVRTGRSEKALALMIRDAERKGARTIVMVWKKGKLN